MNQEKCDVILEKGVEVQIFPYGNPKNECEGVAKLIECVEAQETNEWWLVQFRGENRLLKRFLQKPMSPVEVAKPVQKMTKRIVNGKICYFYTAERTSRKSILGMERTKYSEIKYQYQKSRNKKS